MALGLFAVVHALWVFPFVLPMGGISFPSATFSRIAELGGIMCFGGLGVLLIEGLAAAVGHVCGSGSAAGRGVRRRP